LITPTRPRDRPVRDQGYPMAEVVPQPGKRAGCHARTLRFFAFALLFNQSLSRRTKRPTRRNTSREERAPIQHLSVSGCQGGSLAAGTPALSADHRTSPNRVVRGLHQREEDDRCGRAPVKRGKPINPRLLTRTKSKRNRRPLA
jgi:hypothetical protein